MSEIYIPTTFEGLSDEDKMWYGLRAYHMVTEVHQHMMFSPFATLEERELYRKALKWFKEHDGPSSLKSD